MTPTASLVFKSVTILITTTSVAFVSVDKRRDRVIEHVRRGELSGCQDG